MVLNELKEKIHIFIDKFNIYYSNKDNKIQIYETKT